MRNETKTDFDLLTYINTKSFVGDWEMQQSNNTYLQQVLNITAKKGTGNKGYPDLIYNNENRKLLILIENKSSIQDHISKNKINAEKFAVDGIKHYLSFFTQKNLAKQSDDIQRYFFHWKIIGIAFSGDINDAYNHRLDTFVIQGNQITNINESSILNEDDYISYFENIDLEKIAIDISKSSKKINNLLRNTDSQKRPILLSALMICLYDNGSYFKNHYQNMDTQTIINNIPATVNEILRVEGIDINKIEILNNQLSFINTDKDLTTTSILKDTLQELENNVLPLFSTQTTYDIIGKFYEEFLRYAGIANVKKGIVLTPNHITTLFTELIDLKTDDVIFDPTCGTGAFLIAGMNKLIETINNSHLPDKKERIANIKNKQLIGIEKSDTMFTLAISNMLFRGDGKSKIFNEDFFSSETDNILYNIENKPTIGFINPPFGGKDNKANPTKKEVQFLEKLLDTCSRFVVIIAPLSIYFQDDVIRTRLLTKHRLKAVINMPSELFQPNAMTHTAIAVFETNIPHTKNDKTVFYDLKDDGFVLSKNKGRTDPKNKWSNIKDDLLEKLENPKIYADDINLVYKHITGNDEWIIQAHSRIDYSSLNAENFLTSIRENIVFQVKKDLNLLTTNIDQLKIFEILSSSGINKNSCITDNIKLHPDGWKEFKLYNNTIDINNNSIFDIKKGERLVELDRVAGEVPLITASSYNNGIATFIDLDTFESKKKIFINQITIDMFANIFYHNYKYFSDDNVHTLLLKEHNIKLNKYHIFFIIGILKKLKPRYGFGRQVRVKRLEQEFIKLPAKLNKDKEYEPDWEFMENYIKSLPYSANL